MLGDRVGSPVGVPDEEAIGSLHPDWLVDVERLGLIVAFLLSEFLTSKP
jgi:hypothetical protein